HASPPAIKFRVPVRDGARLVGHPLKGPLRGPQGTVWCNGECGREGQFIAARTEVEHPRLDRPTVGALTLSPDSSRQDDVSLVHPADIDASHSVGKHFGWRVTE